MSCPLCKGANVYKGDFCPTCEGGKVMFPKFDLVKKYTKEISKWLMETEEKLIVEHLSKTNPEGLVRLRDCINKVLDSEKYDIIQWIGKGGIVDSEGNYEDIA